MAFSFYDMVRLEMIQDRALYFHLFLSFLKLISDLTTDAPAFCILVRGARDVNIEGSLLGEKINRPSCFELFEITGTN